MKKNLGTIDKIVRITLAAAFAVLIYLGEISGTAAIILGILGAIFVLTSSIGFCPLYFPFNISTRMRSKEDAASPSA